MLVFLVMILVSFTAISVVVSAMFMRYTVDTKKEIITRSSAAIVDYMHNDCDIVDIPSFETAINKDYDSIRSFISSISPFSDELIFMIAFPNGTIPIYDSNVPYGYIAENIPISVMDEIKLSDGITQVDIVPRGWML